MSGARSDKYLVNTGSGVSTQTLLRNKEYIILPAENVYK